MTHRLVRLGHCYRCIYTWRMRDRNPRVCPRCKSKCWDVPKVLPLQLGDGLGPEEILAPHRSAILRLARQHGVTRVRVFGSVRRREAGRDSDVDLLLDWKHGTSLLDVARFRLDLQDLLGRKVDTVELGNLHWAIRPQVESEAIPL